MRETELNLSHCQTSSDKGDVCLESLYIDGRSDPTLILVEIYGTYYSCHFHCDYCGLLQTQETTRARVNVDS